jgi:hypothetical protein
MTVPNPNQSALVRCGRNPTDAGESWMDIVECILNSIFIYMHICMHLSLLTSRPC